MPATPRILGAAKLTGRTRTGWSIGTLDAVTRREAAPVQFDDSTRGTLTVEPATNYFATRVAKDLAGGATQLRAMVTSVYRDPGDPYLANRLSHHSEAWGIATDSWWSNRTYAPIARVAWSQLTGNS